MLRQKFYGAKETEERIGDDFLKDTYSSFVLP
jgi:hypothetical protein